MTNKLHCRAFSNHTVYDTTKTNGEINRPSVSYCIEQNEVHYDDYLFAEWVDPEIKRIILANFNGGREMTDEDLAAITQEEWDSIVHKNTKSSIFRGNTDIKSIDDIAKFTGVSRLGDYTFSDCTGLTGELTIPQNIKYLNNYVFSGCTGYKSIRIDHDVECAERGDNWGPQTFGKMNGIEGVIDLRNLKKIGTYHEFDGFGSKGSGCKIIMPSLEQGFGVWFMGSRVSAMADSEENLEEGTIKIPEGYTSGGALAFNNCPKIHKIICPETMTMFDSFSGGDESWNYLTYFEMGSKTTLLKGGVCAANSYSGGRHTTVVCKAVTPPEIKQGGVGIGDGNNKLYYPFLSTRISSLYVPDESVDLYKNSSTIVATAVTPFSYGGKTEENVEIGWKRFADVIKPLSQLPS